MTNKDTQAPAPKLRVTGFRGNPLRVVLSNGDEATVTQKLVDAFASPSPFDHGVTESAEGVTNAENGAVQRQSVGQTSPSARATANE
ncbi:hypothetical protein [Rhizobium sp. Root483D2]|uniref:hypothetical protein n=1 Tax=Rhizobium sp. Root483D2 TaxID=1736545 RepID=UPI0007125208|nr:hypothetical protein [Rhizobium sp. Root483D2]KQY22562.1 hypothetical protein ASD32_27065 [Rhizobium sp. Root483D2]